MNCIKCNVYKTFDRYYKKHNKEGYRPKCKDCCNLEIKERKERKNKGLPSLSELRNNKPLPNEKICSKCEKKQKIDNFHKIGAIKNGNGRKSVCKHCCKIQLDKWKINNKEKTKEYRQRPEINKKRNENTRKWRENNEKEMYISRMRSETYTIVNSIKNKKFKYSRCEKLFNCSIKFLKEWIEFQFDVYMNWENYGSYWSIDHVKPCCLFNFPEESFICSHWTNIRPVERLKNSIKNFNFDSKIQLMHNIIVKVFIKGKKTKNETMDNPQPSP